MKHTFFRAFKFAFQDFWRNIWLSLVTVTVLVLALLSVNVLISLNAISNSIINSVEKKVDISVFFKENVTEAQVDNFQEKIKSMSEVEESVYISKEKALADFREKHRGDKSIMEALRQVEENPLLDALVIRAKSTDDYSRILSTLSMGKNQELIKYQNYTDHKKIIEKVSVLRDKVKTFSISLTAIFSLIAVLIVFNSIRVMIYTHREEIAVMRLVGASNSFIRAPYILESVIYVIFAFIIAMIFLYVIIGATGPYLNDFLQTYDFSLLNYYAENFFVIFGAQFLAVVVLNIVSSGIAIGRYLKI